MRSGFTSAGLLLGFTFMAAPAWAEAIARASANSGSFSASANSANDPALVNEPHVSARARASDLSDSALAAAGNLNSCFQALPNVNCGSVGTDVLVDAFAAANGNNGLLRAGARSSGGGRGSARATLRDTVTLSSPLIDINLHLNAPNGAPQASTANSIGTSELRFRLSIDTPNPSPDDPPDITLFAISTFRDDEGSFFSAGFGLEEDAVLLDSGTSIRESFHYEIDLTDPAFAGLFIPVTLPGGFQIPPLFDLDDPLELNFELVAEAACFSNSDCLAQARAEETLYIKIDGESGNGYSYPGQQIVVDPPIGIPEPATALMLLAGLAGIAAGARRRR